LVVGHGCASLADRRGGAAALTIQVNDPAIK
jgi:hypothetical protein